MTGELIALAVIWTIGVVSIAGTGLTMFILDLNETAKQEGQYLMRVAPVWPLVLVSKIIEALTWKSEQ